MFEYSFLWSGSFLFIGAALWVLGYAVAIIARLTRLIGTGRLHGIGETAAGYAAPPEALLARFSKLLDDSLTRLAIVPNWVFCGLVLLVFCLPLIGAWTENQVAPPYVIGALLPWSDSAGWLHGLNQFLIAGELNDWVVRRPVALVYLATLFGLTGVDLQLMLLLRTVILGLACWYFVREIAQYFGAIAALVALTMVASFAYVFTPTVLTEISGLTFGLVAATLLWRGVNQESIRVYSLGVVLLSFGFAIRTGAVFMLGAVVLWPLLAAITASNKQRFIWSGTALGAVLSGIVLSLAWVSFAYNGENEPGANFAFTLWGLAHGGAPWHEFFAQNGFAGLSEGKQARLAYDAAFAQIAAHPQQLLLGFWTFLEKFWRYLLYYLPWEIRGYACLFMLVGLMISLRSIKSKQSSWLVVSSLGVIATVPIIFWSLDAYRALAVTIPLDALLVAVAVKSLRDLAIEGQIQPVSGIASPSNVGLVTFAALLVISVTLLPLSYSLAADESPPSVAKPDCRPGQYAGVFALGTSSPYIRIAANRESRRIAPDISFDDFRRYENFGNVDLAPILDRIQPGTILASGFELSRRNGPIWVLMDERHFTGPGRYATCSIVIKNSVVTVVSVAQID